MHTLRIDFRICKTIFSDSKTAGQMTCSATKCTQIANTVGEEYSTGVVETMRKHPFTLMIDESNDHGADKVLALLARVCDGNPRTMFVQLLPCPDGTATGLFNSINQFFRYAG